MMAVNMVVLVGGWTWTKLETPNFQNFLRNVWSPSKSIGFFFEIKQWSHLRSFLVKIKTGAGCRITCEDLSHVCFLFESQLKHLFLGLQGPWLIFLAPLATCFEKEVIDSVCDHPNISTWQVSPLPYLSWWTSSHSSLCLPCPQLDRLTTWKTVLSTHSNNMCIYVWRVPSKFSKLI